MLSTTKYLHIWRIIIYRFFKYHYISQNNIILNDPISPKFTVLIFKEILELQISDKSKLTNAKCKYVFPYKSKCINSDEFAQFFQIRHNWMIIAL